MQLGMRMQVNEYFYSIGSEFFYCRVVQWLGRTSVLLVKRMWDGLESGTGFGSLKNAGSR